MSDEVKKCNYCEETKPITEFYKNKLSKDGLGSTCKTCIALKNKKKRTYADGKTWHKSHLSLERKRLFEEGFITLDGKSKKCRLCEMEKPLEEFRRDFNYKDFSSSLCIKHENEKFKALREKNVENNEGDMLNTLVKTVLSNQKKLDELIKSLGGL
jgi:hypothetical protein